MTTETGGLQLALALLAEGKTTCSVPVAGRVLGFKQDKAYSMANGGDIPTLGKTGQRVVPLPLLLHKLGVVIRYDIKVDLENGAVPVQQLTFDCAECGQTYSLDVIYDHYDQHEAVAWASTSTTTAGRR